jgi:hypothetical protein
MKTDDKYFFHAAAFLSSVVVMETNRPNERGPRKTRDAAPILKGIESGKAWQEHCDAIFDALKPVGYLEEMFTHRIALITWKLSRVARFEAKVITDRMRTAESELEEQRRLKASDGKPEEPTEELETIEITSGMISMLETLSTKNAGEKIATDIVKHAIYLFLEELPEDVGYVPIRCVPEDQLDNFNDWTAALFRDVVNAYASASRMSPDSFLQKCIAAACEKRDDARFEVRSNADRQRTWELLLARERSKILVDPAILDAISRYDSSYERSFFRTLHELQRLQVIRRGTAVPAPRAVDLDVAIHTEGES